MRKLFFAIVCLLLISNIMKAQNYIDCTQECPAGYSINTSETRANIFIVNTNYGDASYIVRMNIKKCCNTSNGECVYLIEMTSIEPQTNFSRSFTNSILSELIKKVLGKSREFFGILGNINNYNVKIRTRACYPIDLTNDSLCTNDCCISNYQIENVNKYDVIKQVSSEKTGDTCRNEGCIYACASHNIELNTKIYYSNIDCPTDNPCYWGLFGNSNIDDDYNFIGPINGKDFIVKTGDIALDSLFERLRITSDGKFSIGINNPIDIFTVGLNRNFNSKISFGNEYDNPSIKLYRAIDNDSCFSFSTPKAFPWRIEVMANDFGIPSGSLVFKSGEAQCSDGYETISPKMLITRDGRVGIGTLNPLAALDVSGYIISNNIIADNIAIGTDSATARLDINGASNMINLKVKGIILTEEIRVKPSDDPDWPDNVFDENYKRMSINQIEDYIKSNKHLPGIPSKNEILSNGVNLNEMQMLLLKKIEELTLEIIDLKKELNSLKKSK